MFKNPSLPSPENEKLSDLRDFGFDFPRMPPPSPFPPKGASESSYVDTNFCIPHEYHLLLSGDLSFIPPFTSSFFHSSFLSFTTPYILISKLHLEKLDLAADLFLFLKKLGFLSKECSTILNVKFRNNFCIFKILFYIKNDIFYE